MIFLEEFSQTTLFRNRLKHIYQSPPVRGGAQFPFRHDLDDLEQLSKALSPTARGAGSGAAFSRISRIEYLHKLREEGVEAVSGRSDQRAAQLVEGLAT